MINLIPNQEKKKMRRDFYVRFVVLSLFLLSFSLFVGTLALLPSYFLSVSKNTVINQKLEEQKAEPTPPFDEETRGMIKDLNLKLGSIENAKSHKFVVSEKIIDSII